MPMDFEAHRLRMVNHFIRLETLDPVYATWALNEYRKTPSCPYPGILQDVKAQKARRAIAPAPASPMSSSLPTSSPSDSTAPPTP